MIYSESIKKAMWILVKAHGNDVDKGGYPYIFHPYHVAEQVSEQLENDGADRQTMEDAVCVALLHDYVEDHGDGSSFNFLRGLGFDTSVVDALRLMTHDKSVEYMDYVKAIKSNSIARSVKIADLKHNMDTSRTDGRPAPKAETYKKALKYLTEE